MGIWKQWNKSRSVLKKDPGWQLYSSVRKQLIQMSTGRQRAQERGLWWERGWRHTHGMTKNLDFQGKTGACVFCSSENENPLDNKEINCVYI